MTQKNNPTEMLSNAYRSLPKGAQPDWQGAQPTDGSLTKWQQAWAQKNVMRMLPANDPRRQEYISILINGVANE